ncbi:MULTISPECIES: hypothetical protein [Bacteroides]|uniref:hypothetical protein n=1 Tax=Bacteroides TaxID=816 RepID=UPI0034A499DC
MKVRNLFAASLAAMSFFSCSNEVDELNSGTSLAPGDALISIDLSGGKTTYSTIDKEGAIVQGSAKLFKAGGAEIELTDPKFEGTRFTAKISADKFTAGEEARLYLYANSPIRAGRTTQSSFRNILANTTLDYDLSDGLPVSGIKVLTLQAGAIQPQTLNLTRRASRLGATVAAGYNLSDLKDYKVSVANYRRNGYLFNGGTGTDFATVTEPSERTLTGNASNMYNGTETTHYLYPSTNVAVRITAPDGSEREATFSPEAGKNYILTITPTVGSGEDGGEASLGWNVTIDEWAQNNNGMEVDFTPMESNLEKLLVEIGGNRWMPFNTSGSLATDEETATAILTQADAAEGTNGIDKLHLYVQKSKANYEKIAGKFFTALGAINACPAGYRIANLADYAALAGLTVVPNDDSKWVKNTTFSNGVTLVQSSFSYPITVPAELRDWYWNFIQGANNEIELPFIGAHFNVSSNTHTVPATSTQKGFALWTGELVASTTADYYRVAPWHDGWAKNTVTHGVNTTSYVRCVKK